MSPERLLIGNASLGVIYLAMGGKLAFLQLGLFRRGKNGAVCYRKGR